MRTSAMGIYRGVLVPFRFWEVISREENEWQG